MCTGTLQPHCRPYRRGVALAHGERQRLGEVRGAAGVHVREVHHERCRAALAPLLIVVVRGVHLAHFTTCMGSAPISAFSACRAYSPVSSTPVWSSHLTRCNSIWWPCIIHASVVKSPHRMALNMVTLPKRRPGHITGYNVT